MHCEGVSHPSQVSHPVCPWIEANGIDNLVTGLKRLPRPSDENGGTSLVLQPIDNAAVNGEDHIPLLGYSLLLWLREAAWGEKIGHQKAIEDGTTYQWV